MLYLCSRSAAVSSLVRLLMVVGLMVLAAPLKAQTAGTGAEQGLTVYCGAIAQWCELMRQAFETKTGIKTLVIAKSAGEGFAQIKAEAANPRADIWWAGGGDQHLQAAELGLTEEYRSPMLAKLHPWAVRQAEISGWRTVGIYAGTLGVVWNTEQLAKRNLPAPKCWADLIKPDYKDEIQLANAQSSGTSYAFIATMVQIMGEEQAFAYLKTLHRSINQYPRSGAAPMQNVARGESTLAITWMFAAVAEAEAGFPVTNIAPCEGTGYEIGSMSIIKGAKNLANAKLFYDFALSPEAQATGARAKSFQIPSNVASPLPPKTPLLSEVKLINYDFATYGSDTVRTRLIKRWESEVLNSPR
jgi:iron(III) transport system substrate-binding protein